MSTTVKTRSIPFSAAMVKAIQLNKAQTRRVISDKWIINADPGRYKYLGYDTDEFNGALFEDLRPEITPWLTPIPCPYGQPGERLAVGEAWRTLKQYDGLKPTELPDDAPISFEADGVTLNGHWGRYRNARFLPMRFRRLVLEIVSVRVQRLQDISEADAVAEGCQMDPNGFPAEIPDESGIGMIGWDCTQDWYADFWESINGPGSWEANPWVWVVSFKRITA